MHLLNVSSQIVNMVTLQANMVAPGVLAFVLINLIVIAWAQFDLFVMDLIFQMAHEDISTRVLLVVCAIAMYVVASALK